MRKKLMAMNAGMLTLFFYLLPPVLCAQDETHMETIVAAANARASMYGDEVQTLSTRMLANQSEQMTRYETDIHALNETKEPIATHLNKVSQVVVFLSFAMPEKSIYAWLLQCKQSGATPVIRGLIHNSFKETMGVMQNLSQKTGVGMQLDPILFKMFAIHEVPAVVYIKSTPPCPANMGCKPVLYDKIYGDVSLDYALAKMLDGATTQEPVLESMLRRLSGGVI